MTERLAPVLDLGPRLRARAAEQPPTRRARHLAAARSRAARALDLALDLARDVVFAAGLAWSAWRQIGRPR